MFTSKKVLLIKLFRTTKKDQKYIVWLHGHTRKWNEANKDNQLEEVDPTLFDMGKGNVKNFWDGLIKFLFAFLQSFSKNKDGKSTN